MEGVGEKRRLWYYIKSFALKVVHSQSCKTQRCTVWAPQGVSCKNWTCLQYEHFPTASTWSSNANCSFPRRHWLYSNSQLLLLLLLLLPGNIQYFIVQFCLAAEQKSAFHPSTIYLYRCACISAAAFVCASVICVVQVNLSSVDCVW